MESIHMEFSREVMQDIAAEDTDEFIKMEDSIIDHTRWSVVHEMIFKQISTGLFYRSSFNRGATEMQDEHPYEYDSDIIKCQQVERKEIKSYKWVPISKEG